MQTAISITEFIKQREQRRQDLGLEFTEEYRESLRNRGDRRTPEKRAALKFIEERCRATGIKPLKGYF